MTRPSISRIRFENLSIIVSRLSKPSFVMKSVIMKFMTIVWKGIPDLSMEIMLS